MAISCVPNASIIARINSFLSKGTSHDETYAASAWPFSAARPAASPASGPCPSIASRVTIVSPGSGGSSWPTDATTTTGETTSPTIRTMRASIVSSPNGRESLGRPMRALCPPHSTIPPTRSEERISTLVVPMFGHSAFYRRDAQCEMTDRVGWQALTPSDRFRRAIRPRGPTRSLKRESCMLRVPGDASRFSRRHLLQVGGLGLLGVTLPKLLESRARADAAGTAPKADACILLFLNGGPSHLDMWDPKPDAPDGIRGEFRTIDTSLPGYRVGEHMPRLARHMHRATIVRSMHHGVNNSHAAAVYASLTGHDRGELGGGTQPTDYPSTGSLVSLFRPPTVPVLSHVTLPYMTKEGAGGPPQPGFFGGFLGHARDPLFVLRDPNAKDFEVPELTLQTDISAQRLEVRRALYEQLQQSVNARFGGSSTKTMSAFQSRAIDLLTSPETQRAFQLAK